MSKTKILGNQDIQLRLDRIAWEIYEANADEQELTVIGVEPNGTPVQAALVERLQRISPLTLSSGTTDGGKAKQAAALDVPVEHIQGKNVLLVDDVLYSGKTLLRSLTTVMAHAPARIQVAVLIDRGHRSVPISADFTGMVLATTLKQYVSVELDAEEFSAYLF